MDKTQDLIDEMLESFKYLLDQAVNHTTKIYDGMLVKPGANGKWQVRLNGEMKEIPLYGSGTPVANKMVKVMIPQGNMNLAYFMV